MEISHPTACHINKRITLRVTFLPITCPQVHVVLGYVYIGSVKVAMMSNFWDCAPGTVRIGVFQVIKQKAAGMDNWDTSWRECLPVEINSYNAYKTLKGLMSTLRLWLKSVFSMNDLRWFDWCTLTGRNILPLFEVVIGITFYVYHGQVTVLLRTCVVRENE